MRGTHTRLEALELRTLFSTFHVTTGDDGVAGSLREAIAAANASPGSDVIVLQTSTVTLNSTGAAQDADQSADLDVTDDLRIVGTGTSGSTVDAAGLDRVFDVSGTSLQLQSITVTGGQAVQGGGVRVSNGSLLVNHSTITGNTASDPTSVASGQGGGIYALNSDVTVSDSTVSDNHAIGGTTTGMVAGGGIAAVGGTTTVSLSMFTNNTALVSNTTATVQARGGAIYGQSNALSVDSSTFTSNSVAANKADGQGGAVGIRLGSGTITNSVFSDNQSNSSSSAGATAGAVGIDGGTDLLVSGSTLNNNSVTAGVAFGGAIAGLFSSGTVHVLSSQIQDNATNGPGLIAEGGGIYLAGTNGLVESTTLAGNSATGGVVARGGGISFFGLPTNRLDIRDSTITNNSAIATTFPANGQGGGVSVLSGTATADDDTVISGNHASGTNQDVFGTVTIVPD